jgi:PAS domain S-box-containing protein
MNEGYEREEQAVEELAGLHRRLSELEAADTQRKWAEAGLRESEEWFQSILHSLKDVVWAASGDGSEFLYINEAAERVYGRPISEFFENPHIWAEVVHPQDAERVWKESQDLLEQGTTESEYRIIRTDGQERWLQDRKTVVFDDEGNPVRIGGIASDITRRKRAEGALQLQRDLAVALNRTRSLGKTLDAILEGLFRIEEFDSGGVYLVDEQAKEVVLKAHKNLPEWFVGQVSRFGQDTPQWQLIMQGKPIYQHASGFPSPIAEELENERIKALAVIPLIYDGKVIGDLNLASHTHDEISEESRSIAWSIANLVGSAIARARAEEELSKHREHLEELVEERTTKLQQEIAERKRAEEKLRYTVEELERTNADLERFNRLAVGRELRMIELKRAVNALSQELGREPPYDVSFAEAGSAEGAR